VSRDTDDKERLMTPRSGQNGRVGKVVFNHPDRHADSTVPEDGDQGRWYQPFQVLGTEEWRARVRRPLNWAEQSAGLQHLVTGSSEAEVRAEMEREDEKAISLRGGLPLHQHRNTT
jgi:hypothetical protein